MKTKGIRISDLKNGKCIPLAELLKDIMDPNQFYWGILWLDVTPVKNEGENITKLMKKVNHSAYGIPCKFEFLVEISRKIFQEIEVLIVGCRIQGDIHRYKDDEIMYETCDIVLEMIDGGFWEVFSKNDQLITLLGRKYHATEFLMSDFQKKRS